MPKIERKTWLCLDHIVRRDGKHIIKKIWQLELWRKKKKGKYKAYIEKKTVDVKNVKKTNLEK